MTLPTAATPTFSPAAGVYTAAQSVTISTATSGASIRYTTDGTDPTSTTGTPYTGPVSVASTLTLKAIAYKSGYNDSAVGSATYTVLVRTARGQFANKTSNASWTVGNITVSSGEALFVVVGGNATTLPTVTWGGTALAQDNTIQTGAAAIAIYSLLNPTPGTQSLVISWSGTIPAARACTVTTVGGLVTSSAVDTNVNAKNGNITSTNPSTGASGSSAQAREFVIAGVLTQGPDGDTVGSTSYPFYSGQRLGTTGQNAGTNVTVHELYKVTNTVGSSTASKLGITSRTWWAIEQGYKALIP